VRECGKRGVLSRSPSCVVQLIDVGRHPDAQHTRGCPLSSHKRFKIEQARCDERKATSGMEYNREGVPGGRYIAGSGESASILIHGVPPRVSRRPPPPLPFMRARVLRPG